MVAEVLCDERLLSKLSRSLMFFLMDCWVLEVGVGLPFTCCWEELLYSYLNKTNEIIKFNAFIHLYTRSTFCELKPKLKFIFTFNSFVECSVFKILKDLYCMFKVPSLSVPVRLYALCTLCTCLSYGRYLTKSYIKG